MLPPTPLLDVQIITFLSQLVISFLLLFSLFYRFNFLLSLSRILFSLFCLLVAMLFFGFASGILFNPKTVKSQIQGGIYSVKSNLNI